MSKIDINKIKDFKNIHLGERCFIIGTGPSLTTEFLDKIVGEKSFAVNSAYLAYKHTKWRPNYYMVTDDSAFKILGDGCYTSCVYDAFFLGTSCKDRIPNGINLCVNSSNHFLIGTIWNKLFPRVFPIARCSKDIAKEVFGGKTVIYPVIQIAMYMGFKEIYLIGVDCNYGTKNNHATIVEGQGRQTFSQSWADRTSEMMVMQFDELSRKIPRDVHVYNLSQMGNLDSFPRKRIDEVL